MRVKRDEMSAVNLEVGFRIRRLREEAGMSQMDLANQIDLSYQQVQKYESGKNKVSLERLCQIALVFNTDVGYFLPKVGKQEEAAAVPPPILSNEERRLLKLFRRVKNAKFKQGILLQLQAASELEGNAEPSNTLSSAGQPSCRHT